MKKTVNRSKARILRPKGKGAFLLERWGIASMP